MYSHFFENIRYDPLKNVDKHLISVPTAHEFNFHWKYSPFEFPESAFDRTNLFFGDGSAMHFHWKYMYDRCTVELYQSMSGPCKFQRISFEFLGQSSDPISGQTAGYIKKINRYYSILKFNVEA